MEQELPTYLSTGCPDCLYRFALQLSTQGFRGDWNKLSALDQEKFLTEVINFQKVFGKLPYIFKSFGKNLKLTEIFEKLLLTDHIKSYFVIFWKIANEFYGTFPLDVRKFQKNPKPSWSNILRTISW